MVSVLYNTCALIQTFQLFMEKKSYKVKTSEKEKEKGQKRIVIKDAFQSNIRGKKAVINYKMVVNSNSICHLLVAAS